MFGKLKEAVAGGAASKMVEKVSPQLAEQLKKVESLSPEMVQDDTQYQSTFVKPCITAISAATSGIAKIIPGFEAKMTAILMRLRDDIIEITDGKVKLVDGYQGKLAPAIISGLKG
jgi:hypothetical protein